MSNQPLRLLRACGMVKVVTGMFDRVSHECKLDSLSHDIVYWFVLLSRHMCY